MSRSVFHTKTNKTKEEAYQIATGILNSDGYKQIDRNGETVWKKGTGAMTAMHFIKLEYQDGDLIISGWVQIGLGSSGLNDMDLTGFVSALPKKSTFKTIQKIRKAVM